MWIMDYFVRFVVVVDFDLSFHFHPIIQMRPLDPLTKELIHAIVFVFFFFLLYASLFSHVQSSKNRRKHSRKTEPESEESDSDQDPLTSSRTESSNHPQDLKIKHSNVVFSMHINATAYFTFHFCFVVSLTSFFLVYSFLLFLGDAGIIYHGNQSSTSSDLSPMSEQKSLPRRGRSRYHQQSNPTYTINTTPRHKTPTILAPIPKTPTQALSQHVTHHPATQHQQYPQQTHIVASTTSPRSIYSNKSYSRMPNQFRPLVQHRTINTATQQTILLTRQSPHHIG